MKLKFGDKVKCFINGTQIGCIDVIEKRKGRQWLRHRYISVEK